MDIENVARTLAGIGPCQGLTVDEAKHVAAAGTIRDAGEGDVLIREGDTTREMLVLLDGKAEVWKRDPQGGEDLLLAEIEAGESIGELAMLRSERRVATVRAVRPCKLFVLDHTGFDDLVAKGDPAAFKMGLQLARVVTDRMVLLHKKVMEYFKAQAQPRPQEFASFKQELMSNWDF